MNETFYFASKYDAWTPLEFAKSELPLDDAEVELRTFDEDNDLVRDNYYICVAGREVYDIIFVYNNKVSYLGMADLLDYELRAIEEAGMTFCDDLMEEYNSTERV